MNKDTLVLLLMFAALAGILTLAVVLVIDAMTLAAPDADTTVKVVGSIQ